MKNRLPPEWLQADLSLPQSVEHWLADVKGDGFESQQELEIFPFPGISARDYLLFLQPIRQLLVLEPNAEWTAKKKHLKSPMFCVWGVIGGETCSQTDQIILCFIREQV